MSDSSKWYKAHPGKSIEHMRTHYRKKKQQIYNLFGAKCNICGFKDVRALQIDHKYGGGKKERKLLQDHRRIMINVLRNPDGYQILCANCNWIKRWEKNEGKKTLLFQRIEEE